MRHHHHLFGKFRTASSLPSLQVIGIGVETNPCLQLRFHPHPNLPPSRGKGLYKQGRAFSVLSTQDRFFYLFYADSADFVFGDAGEGV